MVVNLNIVVLYHGLLLILSAENEGTVVNYSGIFITLTPGVMVHIHFFICHIAIRKIKALPTVKIRKVVYFLQTKVKMI
jgi:hypothetical protein